MSPLIDDYKQDSRFDSRVIGKCPVINISVSGINLACLVDTGSMVSTVTESFYRKFIEPLGTLLIQNSFIQLKAANGLEIPYIGYIEVDVHYHGNILKQRGLLIVKDSTDDSTQKRKEAVPGVIGMNIISECRDMLSTCQNTGDLNEVFAENSVFDNKSIHGFARVKGTFSVRIP